MDFGKVGITLNAVKTFLIRNDGATTLDLTDVSIDGPNAADFSAGPPGLPELDPGQSTTFTVTFTANASGARTAALHISSNDADESSFDVTLKAVTLDTPVVLLSPTSRIELEGASLGLGAVGTHPNFPVTYQWLKNGAKIAKATSQQLPFPSVKVSDGGTYTAVMTANGASTQRSATLTVVKFTQAVLVSRIGTSLTLQIPFAGPATFEWKKDGTLIPSVTGNKLNLTSLNASTSTGVYRCTAYEPGGGSRITGIFDVRVFDDKPVVTQNQNLPNGAVGTFYSHQILIDGSTHLSPTSYAATNLPAGVTLNSKTGLISGVPTTAKSYKVKVTASNSIGSSTSTEQTVTISPLADNAQGTFVALVGAHPALNGGLGGRLDLSITSTAAVSGSLTMGTKTYPFKGQLDTSNATPVVNATVPRAGLAALNLHLEFDLTNNLITLSSKVLQGADNIALVGWRLVWKNKGTLPLKPATATPKLFTFGLHPNTLTAGQPDGDGFGSFTSRAMAR